MYDPKLEPLFLTEKLSNIARLVDKSTNSLEKLVTLLNDVIKDDEYKKLKNVNKNKQ